MMRLIASDKRRNQGSCAEAGLLQRAAKLRFARISSSHLLLFNKRKGLSIQKENYCFMHYRILVEGRVQDVGYRSYVRQVAKELGVKGFVRNLHGGSVEIACECEDRVLNGFLEKLERKSEGFAGIHVEKITVEKLEGGKGFKSFEISFD